MFLTLISLLFFKKIFFGADRSFEAFKDWFYWQNLKYYPNLNQQILRDQFINHVFQNSSSLTEAILTNPIAFIRHSLSNVIDIGDNLQHWIFDKESFLNSVLDKRSSLVFEFSIILAIFFLYYRIKKEKINSLQLSLLKSKNSILLIFFTGTLIKTMLICLVFSAQERYFFSIILYSVLVLTILIDSFITPKMNRAYQSIVFILLILIAPTLNNKIKNDFWIRNENWHLNNIVNNVKKIDPFNKLKLYAENPVTAYADYQPGKDSNDYFRLKHLRFGEFLNQNQIDLVAIDEETLKFFKFRGEEFKIKDFLNNYEFFNYNKVFEEHGKEWSYYIFISNKIK